MVTRMFLEYVKEDLRTKFNTTLANILADFGKSQRALDRSLSQDFEGFKASFINEGDRTF